MNRMYIACANLDGFSAGIHYFNDDEHIYVSPSILQRLRNGGLSDLRIFRLVYERDQKPIEEIALEIVNEMKQIPPGSPSADLVEQKIAEANLSPNPKWTLNPHVPPVPNK